MSNNKQSTMRIAILLTFLCAVFSSVSVQGQTFTTLYAFRGQKDGGTPEAPPMLDRAGNLFGTTSLAGDLNCVSSNRGCGTVYELSPTGSFRLLHIFEGEDGAESIAPLIPDREGNGYGTTLEGGLQNCIHGCGVVFKIANPGGEFTVLYDFAGSPDGANPTGPVIRDAMGNLYGVTGGGGNVCSIGSPCGTVFELDSAGSETVLYRFAGGRDGVSPYGRLVGDPIRKLYGTTWTGGGTGCGGFGCGTVFEVDAAGSESVSYRFAGASDGANPYAGLISDGRSVVGTTLNAGDPSCTYPGCGTVFSITAGVGFSALYDFEGTPDGSSPSYGSLVLDSAGNLYGTTMFGGTYGCGTVFELAPNGNETTLYDFSCGFDGEEPTGVVRDSVGNVYGTTRLSGAYGYGTVFKLTPQ